MATADPPVLIDGTGLTCEQVRRVARDRAPVSLSPAGIDRARAAAEVVRDVVTREPVYGRTTGVGANRDVLVRGLESHGHRLLRSHAGGAGPLVEEAETRAMMVVRLNQLAAGGSGVQPAILEALAEALNLGVVPPVRRFGGIGTGDLPALASTALCLLGELPWRVGAMPAVALEPGDAAAFISSNAATLGEAALALEDARQLDQAALVVAALGFVAIDGDRAAYEEPVQDARPHPGQGAAAARLRSLLAGQPARPARVQDPYGFRALPQVHGAAEDAASELERVLQVDINAASENPLVDVGGGRVLHNGNFHSAYLALALDGMSLALYLTATLSAARLSYLMDSALTRLRSFLADGPAGSSGLMILEYVAQSCLAELHRYATPAAAATAVISRGVEDHAPFSTEAARSLSNGLPAYRTVLACELVAATRALRMLRTRPAGTLGVAYDRALSALDPRSQDRPLDADLEVADRLLPTFGAL